MSELVQIAKQKAGVVTIGRVYGFSAAHRLPNVPPAHKCHGLHGHTYKVSVELVGKVQAGTGWVHDFGAIDVAWESLVHRVLDHRYLNEIEGLQNPTSEVLCQWIADRLETHFSGIAHLSIRAIQVSETERSFARLELK